MPISTNVKQVFNTSVGTIEVMVDRTSRAISIYRFDAQRRAIAAAIESWDHVDLLDVLSRQVGVPLSEANRIALALREQHISMGSLARGLKKVAANVPAGVRSRTPVYPFGSWPYCWTRSSCSSHS